MVFLPFFVQNFILDKILLKNKADLHPILRKIVFCVEICYNVVGTRSEWRKLMRYRELIAQRSGQTYNSRFEGKGSRRWYQHDIDIIIYSDMFRKMQRKSQLLSICDPVSRSRLIHTFEVVRIAKEISEKLGLNSELTEAIALAHDFGNVAYGKEADRFLTEKTQGLFKHEEISVLMLKVCASRIIPEKYRESAKKAIQQDESKTHILEIDEFPFELEVYGYNDEIYYISMSPEVLDGVLKHGKDRTEKIIADTLEGQVVNYADNIAYLIQDISDFEATGIFKQKTIERYGESLLTLQAEDGNKTPPLSDIVGDTTSKRTAALIERFVNYNKERLENRTYETTFSETLNAKIPVLESEEIVSKAIDSCWKFKEEFYENPLIVLSNQDSKAKMEQIWNILDKNSSFSKNNKCYKEFKELLSSPIFATYREISGIQATKVWKEWEKACFIAHLTCDEIDLVIKSFLERDYVFDLSLPKIK